MTECLARFPPISRSVEVIERVLRISIRGAHRHGSRPSDFIDLLSFPSPSTISISKIPFSQRFGPLRNTRRTYASFTELPRPPPSKQPDPEVFSAPSRPREYYSRPKPRDLPPLQVRSISFACSLPSLMVVHSLHDSLSNISNPIYMHIAKMAYSTCHVRDWSDDLGRVLFVRC